MKNITYFGRNANQEQKTEESGFLVGLIASVSIAGMSIFGVIAAFVGIVIVVFGVMLAWNIIRSLLTVIGI